MDPYVAQFLRAWPLTVGLEGIVLLLVNTVSTYYQSTTNLGFKRCVQASLIASTLTIPYLWFVVPSLTSSYRDFFIYGEIAVLLIEAFFLASFLRISWRRALLYSGLCNLTSLLVGVYLGPL